MTIAPSRSPRLPLVRTSQPPAWRDGFPAYIKVQTGGLQSKGSGLTGLPDEPAACIGHQDRERHDRRLEFPASRARERLRHAHPLDRLDLVRIRSPFRGLAFLREEEVQRPLQIRGQVVPGVHLEELRSLVSRLFQEFAPRTRLGGLSVPRRPARQRLDDSPEPVPVLASEDDLLLRGDREDGGGGPEVHPDPALPCAARQFDLLLRDRRPSLPQGLRRQDAGFRRHGDPGGTATRLLIAVDAPRSGLRSSEHNSYGAAGFWHTTNGQPPRFASGWRVLRCGGVAEEPRGGGRGHPVELSKFRSDPVRERHDSGKQFSSTLPTTLPAAKSTEMLDSSQSNCIGGSARLERGRPAARW